MIRIREVVLALLVVAAGSSAFAMDGGRLRDELRVRALDLVNRERALHGLAPVSLDLSTSWTADAFCEQILRDRIAGHYTLDGIAPYMRYPWAGSRDMLRENVASWSANYSFETASLPDLIGRSHRTMMNERPPDDGHRRAILDPWATHMGFGVAWQGGELRFAQVFLRRAIDWTSRVPAVVVDGHPLPAITGRPHPGWRFEGASLHWEPLPEALSRADLAKRNDYALPKTRVDYRADAGRAQSRLVAAAGGASDSRIDLPSDGSFRVRPALEHGPGVYTLLIWMRKDGAAEPVATGLVSFRVVGAAEPHTSTAR